VVHHVSDIVLHWMSGSGSVCSSSSVGVIRSSAWLPPVHVLCVIMCLVSLGGGACVSCHLLACLVALRLVSHVGTGVSY